MTPTFKSRLVASMLALLLALAAALLVLRIWRLPPFDSPLELTENAYVRGSVTIIAPKVDGYVAEVLVQDYMTVKQGQVLVRLDDRNYRQRVAQARANLAMQETNLANFTQTRRVREANLASSDAQIANARAQVLNARAQLQRAEADMRRVDALMASDSLSQRERDQTSAALHQAEAVLAQSEAAARLAQAGHDVAKQDLRSTEVSHAALQAAVDSARAALTLTEIDLNNTQIRAPRDGRVGEVGVKLGQYVTPGTQLMAVVPPQVWVIANFKETQTARMGAGQRVRLRIDGLRDITLAGHVERLAPATGSEFSVIKPDNATGNFTKIPQRVPVRILIDEGQPEARRLRPGMSVVAEVDTASPAVAEGQP